MWNSIVRRFTLDDEFSCLLLNLSISRISISGKFSYIFYILTQLEWSWPSVTKTVLRATSFPWKPSSSTTRPPSTMGTRLSQDAILNNTVQCYRESQAHLKLRTGCIGAGRFISLPTEIFGNFCWIFFAFLIKTLYRFYQANKKISVIYTLILHINFFEYEKKKIKLM